MSKIVDKLNVKGYVAEIISTPESPNVIINFAPMFGGEDVQIVIPRQKAFAFAHCLLQHADNTESD